MAIVDLNSRYGTYADDAALGGYNRKELRGLSKQARRGTLTQRERARLKYLTDERRGRRKRGLLSGLGGVAATLGGLALAGKLGKGEGGEGRGAALMDAIKSRLAEGKEKREWKREGKRQEMLRKDAMAGDIPASGDYDPIGLEDILLEEENLGGPTSEELMDEVARARRSEGEAYTQTELEELRNKKALEEMRIQETQRSAPMVEDRKQVGNEARGTLSPEELEEYALDLARDQASRVTQGEGEEGSMTIENPATGPVRRDIRFAPASRVTEPLAGKEERSFRGAPPLTFGDEDYGDVLTAKGFRSSDINIDPEGLVKDPVTAKEVLGEINRKRKDLGLEPVERLSEKAMQETEEASRLARGTNMPQGPVGQPAGQLQGPRALVDQILNRYN